MVRNHLAAFDASTGALITSFTHSVNAAVKVLSVSADCQTVYAGGDFTTVDGVTRNRIAAFAAATGALTAWNPNANGRVSGIVATASTVYVAGVLRHRRPHRTPGRRAEPEHRRRAGYLHHHAGQRRLPDRRGAAG